MSKWHFCCLLTSLMMLAVQGAAMADDATLHVLPAQLHYEGQPLKPDKQFGPLEFKGAYVLSSNHRGFGGISSARWKADGTLLALSDTSRLIAIPVGKKRFDQLDSQPITVSRLMNHQGEVLEQPNDDAESMVYFADIGKLLIAFERRHRIMSYDLKTLKPDATIKLPKDITDRLGFNEGFEAMEEIRPNMLAILSESAMDGKGNIMGWLHDIKTVNDVFDPWYYRRTGDFTVSDMILLPDGYMLAVERHMALSGFECRLVRWKAKDVQPNSVIVPEVLASFGVGDGMDNMEALALQPVDKKHVRVVLIADDNYSKRQRTLLLDWQYALGQ